MLKNQKSKSNKSSVVQVIISNFDNKGLKEVKVIYRKNLKPDTIQIKTYNPADLDFKIRTNKQANQEEYAVLKLEAASSQSDQNLSITSEPDGSLRVKHLRGRTRLKDYILSAEYIRTKTGKLKLSLAIEDRLYYQLASRPIREKTYGLKIKALDYSLYSQAKSKLEAKNKLRRSLRPRSATERVLLDQATTSYYGFLAGESTRIDSREISRLNKFLDYRSSILAYLGLIGQVVGQDLEKLGLAGQVNILDNLDITFPFQARDQDLANKIFKLEDFRLNLRGFVDRHNDYIDYKLINLDQGNVDYPRLKAGWQEKYIDLEALDLEEDLRKLGKIFRIFNKRLVHYDYEFFTRLHQGEDLILEGESLSQLLDLVIFKELEKLDLIKFNIRSNYLEERTRIYVLGENVKAKKLLSRYINIEARLPGFNKFINYNIDKYLGERGQALDQYNDYFFKTIKVLEAGKNPNPYILKEYKDLKALFDRPFVEDVHMSKEYKALYNRRKELVTRKNSPKYRGEILGLNRKMKRITNLNSKYRLQVKMQFALAYISKYWLDDQLDLKAGGLEEIFSRMEEDFRPDLDSLSREEFLDLMMMRDRGRRKLASNLINYYEFKNQDNIFDQRADNNLIKLYILLYNFIPRELRKTFLKQVKKYIYESRFIDKEDRSKYKNSFFENIKLFERNLNKLTLIDYSALDIFSLENSKEKLKNRVKSYILDNISSGTRSKLLGRISGKTSSYMEDILDPIFNYYLIVLKLLNDLDLIHLYRRHEKYGTKLEDLVGREPDQYILKDLGFEKLLRLREEILSQELGDLFLQGLEPSSQTSLARRINLELIKLQQKNQGWEAYGQIINNYHMRQQKLVDDLTYFVNMEAKYKVSNIRNYKQAEASLEALVGQIEKGEKNLVDLYATKKMRLVKKEERQISKFYQDLEVLLARLVRGLSLDLIKEGQVIFVQLEKVDRARENQVEVENYYYSYRPELDSYWEIFSNDKYRLDGSILTLVERRDEKLPIQKIDLSRQPKHRLRFVLK